MTGNEHAIILTKTDSPYFKECIFVLKENVVKEEDKLLNEARNVAEMYAKKCEKSKMLVKTDRKNTLKYGFSALLGIILGATAAVMIIFA